MIKVFYHFPCLDGFGAAMVARKKFGKAAQYFELQYNRVNESELLSELELEDEVYFIDICPSEETLSRIQRQVKRVVVLDHHETARQALEGRADCTLDITRSGVQIAWDHFFPLKLAPRWVNYLEDRDLWRFQYPETKAFNAGLNDLGYSFEKWEKLDSDEFVDQMIKNGQSILKREAETIKEAVKNAKIHEFSVIPFANKEPQRFQVAMVSSDKLVSEIGAAINEELGVMAFIRQDTGNPEQVKVSVRSKEDLNEKAINLAVLLGGGGHNHAAGAYISKEAFNQIIKGKLDFSTLTED